VVDYIQSSDSLFSGKETPLPKCLLSRRLDVSVSVSGWTRRRKEKNFATINQTLRNFNGIKHGDEHCNNVHIGVYVIHSLFFLTLMLISELLEHTLKSIYNSLDIIPKKAIHNSENLFIHVEVYSK
jgi:hypothetical protein